MDQRNDENLLIQAVREGSTNDVKKLLKKGVNVNCINNEDKPPLYYAVKNKNCLNVEMLLEREANVYLQLSTNEILVDHAIDILGSKNAEIYANEKKILQLFEQKICEDSVRILKECEELELTDTRNAKVEKTVDCAVAAVIQKINELLNRLDEDRNFAGYKAANTFLLFLETFTFDDDLTDKYVKDLKKKFLNDDHNAYNSIKKLRAILLKSSSKIRTPAIIFEVIRYCFVTENEDDEIDKKIQFFDKLKAFLKSCKNENPAEIVGNNISTFFKLQDEKEIKAIIDQGQTDDPVNKIVYEKFMNLVLKAYKNEIEEDEHWFEFNINIFPCLAITKKDDKSGRQLENQILRLRHNFVHSFTQHGSEAFKELIIKLRGKLFEYYYVRKLHARLVTSITCKVNEIEDEINKDFESIRGDFKCDNRLYALSEEESKNLFASKFEKSLFPTFVANGEVDQSLIEDYFTFIPVIEYMNKNVKNKSINYDRFVDNIDEEEASSNISENHCLKLDDFSRRRFFEQYVIAKGYLKRNGQENYLREKKRLIIDLAGYGVEEEYIENFFSYYLEEGNKVSDSVFTVIEKVGKFINYLVSTKARYNKESKMITVVESFLEDRNDLVLPTDHFELSEEIEEKQKIIQLVKSFTSINIDGIEVDVKATIKMMVKTFYDIFNEYSIEFNVRDLFSRETFLDALINEEEKQLQEYKKVVGAYKHRLFALITQLVQIDYMSPFIAKLVKQFENEDGGFIKTLIHESIMKRLIYNLINIECINSLSTLLTVKFDKYDPYHLLHDYIVEKENNLELIRQIFNKFDHINGFTNVLTAGNDTRSDEYSKNIIIPFLEIINENAADQLHYIKNYTNNRFRILLNKKLYDSLTGVVGPDPVSEYLSEIVEKSQENRLKEYKAAYDILLESNKIESRFSNQIADCNVLFLNRDVLKAKISCEQENYENSLKLLDSVIGKLDSCKNQDHSDVHASYKLLTLLIKADVNKLYMYKKSHEGKPQTKISQPLYEPLYIEILKHVGREDTEEMNIENVRETYEKIKDNDNYKMLLSVSELLCSAKYFDILTVASESAYEMLRMHTQLDFKERIKKSHILLKAFKIYESIYSYCYEQGGFKNIKTLEFLKYIATTYKELSLSTENSNEKLFYCLKALVRLNLYYDTRKEIPVGFVRNSIKKNIIYALNCYISTYLDVSKMLTNSKDFFNRGDVLTKVYELCKKILEPHEKSSTAEKLSKHYAKILLSIAYICKYRGEYYLTWKFNNSIDFYNESLKYFKESIDAQDRERKEKCFMQMARINNTLFKALTKNYDTKNTKKMNEAAEHLRLAIYFYEKGNRYKCNRLKEQLENHCESHELNFDKIWNKSFKESIDAQDSERQKKGFMQMAEENNTLFDVLTKNFGTENTKKMNEAAEHLRAAIHFYEKYNNDKCNELKKLLKDHCKSHHLNFDKILKKYK